MSLSRWISKALRWGLPPIVTHVVSEWQRRVVHHGFPPAHIFNGGVYRDLADARAHMSQVYEGYESADRTTQLADEARQCLSSSQPNLGVMTGVNHLAPLVFSMALAQKKTATVLDFGGGMGTTFIESAHRVVDHAALTFHVVELEQTVAFGREVFRSFPALTFHTDIPSIPVDMVTIGSTLQYIEDYRALLRRLLDRNPSLVFMANHFMLAGSTPTFATLQVNVEHVQFPIWIFNTSEIVTWMKMNGYRLIYQSMNAIDGQVTTNYDTEHRSQSTNLLFVRE